VAGKAIDVKVLFNRLPTLAADIKAQGEALVERTADNVVTGAQERVHEISGDTKRSIRREGSGSESTVVAGEGAIFEEYGTVNRPAHPFMWPALEAERPVYLAAWRAILAGTGQRAGSATITPGRGTIRRRTSGRLPR
jgi:HK97 gp10 family phage protein